MKLMRMTPTEIALVVLLTASLSVAQAADDWIRKIYTDKDAPRSVFFEFFIDDVFSKSLNPHTGHYHELELGAGKETDLADVFDYLVLLWIEQDKEVGQSTMRMVCPEDAPRPHGEQIFAIFDALDDVRHAIHHKYYAIAKSELIARYSFDLDKALDNYSIGFTQTWGHHEKSWGGSIERVEQAAQTICETGHVRNFIKSERPPE